MTGLGGNWRNKMPHLKFFLPALLLLGIHIAPNQLEDKQRTGEPIEAIHKSQPAGTKKVGKSRSRPAITNGKDPAHYLNSSFPSMQAIARKPTSDPCFTNSCVHPYSSKVFPH